MFLPLQSLKYLLSTSTHTSCTGGIMSNNAALKLFPSFEHKEFLKDTVSTCIHDSLQFSFLSQLKYLHILFV